MFKGKLLQLLAEPLVEALAHLENIFKDLDA